MDDLAKSQDALWEELTLDRRLEDGSSPPWGGYCHHSVMSSTWRLPVKGYDICYYKNKVLHRIYGPAYVSKRHDTEIWYKEGQYHRIGGPAIRHKKNMQWFKDGKRHREDGPAVIGPAIPPGYWIDGEKYSPKQYKKEIARRKLKGLIK
jgi:hypothetical protein